MGKEALTEIIEVTEGIEGVIPAGILVHEGFFREVLAKARRRKERKED